MRIGQNHIPIDTFAGIKGIDVSRPSNQISPQHLVECVNFEIDNGILIKRSGVLGLNATVQDMLVDITLDILYLVNFEDSDGTNHLIACTEDYVYRYVRVDDEWINISPAASGTTHNITGINLGSDTITISGNHASSYTVGELLFINGSTGNDGTYEIVSATDNGGDTDIVVDPPLSDATVDGGIHEIVKLTMDSEVDVYDSCAGRDASGQYIFITNNTDDVMYWDGSSQTMSFSGFSSDISGFVTCKTLEIFKDTLVLGNISTSSSLSKTIMWSDTTDFFSFAGGNSGANIFADAEGDIKKVLSLNDSLIVYADRSIHVTLYVGGDLYLSFFRASVKASLLSTNSVADLGGLHVLSAAEGIFLYDGANNLYDISIPVHDDIYDDIDLSRDYLAKLLFDNRLNKIYFTIPKSGSSIDVYQFVFVRNDIRDSKWTKLSFMNNVVALGTYILDTGHPWNRDVFGAIQWRYFNKTWKSLRGAQGDPTPAISYKDAKVHIMDRILSLDDNNDTIESQFQTMDYTVPPDFLTEYGRFALLEFEAKGTSVTVDYSTDFGLTWTNIKTDLTLDGEYATYKLFFDKTTKNIRFRFTDNQMEAGFCMRWLRVWINKGGGN